MELYYRVLATSQMQHIEVKEEDALRMLESLWFILAEKLFQRVVAVTGLDKKREAALREAALRPNDFRVVPGRKI